MKERILVFGRAFLNLIYPLTCRICEARLSENKGLCRDCISKIHLNRYGIAACEYEGILKQSIHLFKYKGTVSLLNTFSDIFLEFIDRNVDMKNIDMIIPIPLYAARLRERGFNQSYLLSIPISKRYNVPISTGNLVKKKPTKPQSGLNRNQRLKNLKNAFSIKDASSIKRKRLLLVDDVYTTGATVKEASKALKNAGASEIKVVTLAKGV